MRALPLVAVLAFSLPSVVLAEAVSVQLVDRAPAGKGKPKLVVQVNDRLRGLVLELERSDGATLRRGTKGLAPGATHTFELDQPEGVFRWTGALTVLFPAGEDSALPLDFETAVLKPPRVTAASDAVDLAKRSVTVSMDHDAKQLEVRVLADDGTTVADLSESFEGSKAGTPLTVKWSQPDAARVLRIDVRATDRFGFWSDLELYPWSIAIPHEDVLFATGKSDILEAERPKLDAAFEELAAALARYGRFAKVSLFVGGHTDTVGDAGSNRALSEARALSIARYFRKKGVKVPVSYAGFGEDRPLVTTADETDEPRNRRAEYVVAVQAPSGVAWRELR